MRSLFARLLYAMCGVATVAIGVALFLQERTLSHDLLVAAERRLETAAVAADRLLDTHLATQAERYRAISGTPQFRATLEIDDAPTLAHYAGALREQSVASRIAFLGTDDSVVAGAGDSALDAAAFALKGNGVIAHDGEAYAVTSTPIGDAGRMVAVEAIGARTLGTWSELCGAAVAFATPDAGHARGVHRELRRIGDLALEVALSLDAEQEAVANARRNLALAGGLGLALAFGASLVVSQGLVRPILELKDAAGKVGSGDLRVALRSPRGDEIGDVSRAFQRMAKDLGGTVGRVAQGANRVEMIAGDISRAAEGMVHVAQAQERVSEETS